MPDYITELKLGFAFKGHQPPFEDCLKSSYSSELIVDTVSGVSEFSSGKAGDVGFEIVNESGKAFSMIQVDGKLVRNKEGGQCDCCVIDDRFLFFVELKTKAYDLKHAFERYAKAASQIGHTLDIFEEKCRRVGVELRDRREMEGHACFSHLFPRTNATEQNEAVKFLEQHGIPLYFDDKRAI